MITVKVNFKQSELQNMITASLVSGNAVDFWGRFKEKIRKTDKVEELVVGGKEIRQQLINQGVAEDEVDAAYCEFKENINWCRIADISYSEPKNEEYEISVSFDVYLDKYISKEYWKLDLAILAYSEESIEKVAHLYSLNETKGYYSCDEKLNRMVKNSGIEIVAKEAVAPQWKFMGCENLVIGSKDGDYLETVVMEQDNILYRCQAFSVNDENGKGRYHLALRNIKRIELVKEKEKKI